MLNGRLDSFVIGEILSLIISVVAVTLMMVTLMPAIAQLLLLILPQDWIGVLIGAIVLLAVTVFGFIAARVITSPQECRLGR